jgi:hypothetical protein
MESPFGGLFLKLTEETVTALGASHEDTFLSIPANKAAMRSGGA